MESDKGIQSVLRLNRLVFDKIEFKRLGLNSDNELKYRLESNLSQKKDAEIYKTTLTIYGEKKDEYIFEISITGFFSFDSSEEIDEDTKNYLLTQNTISILMPYLRSEVSFLTAQPGMECVVLPPFNINKMMNFDK